LLLRVGVAVDSCPKAGVARAHRLQTLLFVGNASQMNSVEATSAAIAAALEQVPARLRRIRTQRRMTLTGVARSTGISKSTLSRLETGGDGQPWNCSLRCLMPTGSR
jgi:DNA-binding transcriptional regulator YiaG